MVFDRSLSRRACQDNENACFKRATSCLWPEGGRSCSWHSTSEIFLTAEFGRLRIAVMKNPPLPATSRREFLKSTGTAAAAVSVLAGLALPRVHAQGSDQIKIVLIGCGGRGGGAAKNALSVQK